MHEVCVRLRPSNLYFSPLFTNVRQSSVALWLGILGADALGITTHVLSGRDDQPAFSAFKHAELPQILPRRSEFTFFGWQNISLGVGATWRALLQRTLKWEPRRKANSTRIPLRIGTAPKDASLTASALVIGYRVR